MKRWSKRCLAGATFVLALQSADAQGPTVTLLEYHATPPSTWTPQAPTSSARLAQFVIADADGARGADVVVYFFGQGQGGNVDANLARWKSQFSTPDGSPVPERISRDSLGAFPVTFAEYRGTYRRGVGAGSADSARTGQALVAAIAETPRGTLFFQLFGPMALVSRERDRFVAFVKGLR
jgi:hypothetical protein